MDHVISCITFDVTSRVLPEAMERETEAARGEHPSVAHRQPNEMDRACTVEEKTTSSSSKVIPKRSVSEDAKGEVFLKLLLSVSTDRAKEKEYGDLSDAQRAEVDGRVLRVRNNIAMKALKVELKRLKRRRGGRKHHSTHLSGFTIHEQEEAGNVSRPPSSLPTSLGVEREEDLDRVATDKRSHEWKGGKQKSARLSIGTDEVVDVPACTPSTPGITPPLQTSQMKQSVQRVDSNASCWSSDSGYISDRGVPSVNGAMGRAALGDVAEDEEGSGLILDPGWLQGDHLVEKDGSETTPIVATDKDDVFASSFKQALNHRVRVEEHVSTAYDEMGRVVGVFRERSIEESTVMPGMGCMDIQLNEEELSMASNDEEVRYLRELKCRYHAEFSNVMEFQELMKTLNRPPTLSDFLAFKLKFISDRYDTDYEAPINNAVSMIVSGSMDKVLSDSFFSSAVEPLLHQAKKVLAHTETHTHTHTHTLVYMALDTQVLPVCFNCSVMLWHECTCVCAHSSPQWGTPVHTSCVPHILEAGRDFCLRGGICTHSGECPCVSRHALQV